MASKKRQFTEQEKAIIRANPYTAAFSKNSSVSFSLDFKKFAYNEYVHGTKPKKIFEKAGYGNIFSSNYMSKVVSRICAEAQSEEGFKEPRRPKNFEHKALEKMKYEKAIKELQDHIILLEQEIDFLKKISHLNSISK